MTTRRDISLNVIADISKYQQQFAKIPGYTDKQAAKAASQLEKRMSKAAANTAKKATRAAELAGRQAARAADESQRAAIEAGKGLVELAGIPADKFEKFRAVLGGLDSPLGKLALGATGAALAVGGLAVAFTSVATASVAAVRASDELLTKFEKLSEVEGFDIPDRDVESIRDANAALDAVQSSAERLVVIFAGKVAPSVRDVSVEIVKLGLATGDVFDGMGAGAELVGQAYTTMARLTISALTPVLSRLLQLTDLSGSIARIAGLDDLADRFDRISQSVTDIPFTALEVGFAGVQIATQDYQAAAEELVGVSRELADAERESKDETDKSADSRKAAAEAARKEAEAIARIVEEGERRNRQVDEDLALRAQNAKLIEEATAVELSAMGKLAQATDAQLAQAEEIRRQRLENAGEDYALRLQAETEFQEAQTAIVQDYEEKRTQIQDDEAKARAAAALAQEQGQEELRRRFATLAISSAAQATATISQILADQGQKKKARRAFQIAKAFNVAMVAMETIRAAQGALLPPPAGFGAVLGPAAATIIAASGAVQVAAIRAQRPPAFYRGTSNVQRVDGGAGDAVPAVLHQGEAVLNRRAAESMGRQQIEALNAGGGSRAPMVVAISQINHRQFREFYRDDRQLPGSLTRGDRNRSGSRVGRQL